MRFRLPTGSNGAFVSLMDRLFAACDVTAPDFAAYGVRLAPGVRLGSAILQADTDHTLIFEWSGARTGDSCRVSLDGASAVTLALKNPAPNGLSYLHFISAGPGPGIQLQSVEAEVR